MPLQLPPLPDFNLKVPDVNAGMMQAATLSGLLDENKLRQQLNPLLIQEQQEKTKQAAIATQVQQMQLQGQQGLTKWLQEGDTNDEIPADKFSLNDKIATFVGVDPKDPIMGVVRSMAQHGVPAPVLMTEAKAMLERRNEYNKGTEEQQKIIKDNYDVWKDAMGTIFNADPKNYSLLTSQALPRLQQATHLSPELDMAVNMLRQDPNSAVPMVYNMVAAQDKALGLSKTAAEAAKNRSEAANLAAKTDPNSPLYDPSAAYLAKRAAAGDPEAKAILNQQVRTAGAKAGAEAAARQPYELQLKQEEVGQNPAFAFNPQTGVRELTTIGEAKQKGQQFVKVTQADIEKETNLNAQMNDMQLNTSRYRAALNAMGNLSSTDVKNIQRIITNPDIKGMLGDTASTAGWTLGLGSMSQTIAKEAGQAWNELSPDKQEAVIGYLRMKNTGLLAQKVLTGLGRASKEALDIELANMPAPNEGATVGNKKLDAWQENLDQINARSVKLPWMESPSDVRSRVEGQAMAKYNAARSAKGAGSGGSSGTYKPDASSGFMGGVRVGQTTYAGGRRQTVTKVYPDGSYDAQ